MVLIKSFCVLFVVCVTVAEEVEDKAVEQGRNLRDYNDQEWKAVDYFPTDSSAWIPRQPESEEQTPRRRRIRKRKRRPPIVDDQTPEETTTNRKRLRPQRLDQIREPWEDFAEEITQRSYNRRRLTPIYDEPEIKIRDPFTALQEAEIKQKKKMEEATTSTAPDLKTLLKQSGGLSLSEVLQEKNLSLTELLKGNQDAISVLASRTEMTTETTTTKYRRLPPSVALKKDEEEQNDDPKDELKSHEIMEAQRRRLALLHGHKDSRIFSDVTRYDVVTEETTEKRIFVPSNSKFYTSVDYKPNIVLQELTTTPISTTTKAVSVISRTRDLPMTSAKLKKATEIKIPPKAIKIDINEILGFSPLDQEKSTEGPFKMSIDLAEMTTVKPVVDLKMTTPVSLGEKLKHVTAKEEIMEILSNPHEREQLSRILQMKNLTVEELVQLRERGSSQRHLADIFHNKTREPEPEGEPFIGHINAPDFSSFFNRKSKSWPMPPTPSSKPPELTTMKPTYTITSFPTYKIETNKNFKPLLPVWKQLYPSFFPDFHDNHVHKDGLKMTTEKIDYDDIDNTLPEAANSKIQILSSKIYEENEFISLPSGVKSAIFASLAIIGLSLVVFLTILVIFKWTQRHKRLTYTGSFSGSKIKSPILEPDQKRSFKTFMTETLGKKRNYYKAHLQNMNDNFWDTESEKKSYMI